MTIAPTYMSMIVVLVTQAMSRLRMQTPVLEEEASFRSNFAVMHRVKQEFLRDVYAFSVREFDVLVRQILV